MTGNSAQEDLTDFANAGADLVLIKPLKLSTLNQLLQFVEENGVHSKIMAKQRLMLDGDKYIWALSK